MEGRSSPGLKGVEATFRPRPRAFRTITFYWIVQIDSPSAFFLPSAFLASPPFSLCLPLATKRFILFALLQLLDRGKPTVKRCFSRLLLTRPGESAAEASGER